MNLWLQELGSYPRDWGNSRLQRVALRNPSSTRGITERFRSMEPPLWVKGDRGRSEKQEILTARWGCPTHKGGVVHPLRFIIGMPPMKKKKREKQQNNGTGSYDIEEVKEGEEEEYFEGEDIELEFDDEELEEEFEEEW